jgi:dipeptidyl aminopeptidase/acylaminoacyl peptidase
MINWRRWSALAVLCMLFSGCTTQAQVTAADYQRAEKLHEQFSNKVFKKTVEPHWFDSGQKFWYRNDFKDSREFMVVDTRTGTRASAFDNERLAKSLSTALSKPVSTQKPPFEDIEILKDGKVLQFEFEKRQWQFNLDTYECLTPGGTAISGQSGEKKEDSPRPRRRRARERREGGPASPDRLWQVVSRDYNLVLESTQDERQFRLSHDGDPNHFYDRPFWSPDGKVIVAYRITPGDNKEVYRIESSPKEGGRAKLHTAQYALPGDRYDVLEMNLFFVDTKEKVKVDIEPWDFISMPQLRWAKDSSSFTFERPYRNQQRLCVIRVDAKTGKSKVLIDERSETFVNINYNPAEPNYLNESNEIIWSSERDGWRHLYLYDSQTGQLKNQITKGNWVVRGLDRVDAQNRTIIFRASGVDADLDPYFIKYYRVNFDGSGLVCLTPGAGTHTAQFSPDGKCLIDTYSTVQQPPVHELRDTQTGKLICELEKADASELFKAGWKAPEPFVAKGRDGKTDIWGIIVRPLDFDPSKKYPVIEDIYAGPQDSFVPKAWRDFHWNQPLAELGFIVVHIDGMGTMNRSKAFHDVCWKNLGDHGLPDRILWMKAAAGKYPYMDLDRVGVFGTSAGGQSSTAALLFHPEFYKAAVSSCGCHDNLMDKSYWNEQWMGYPVGPHYKEQSNITNAAKLKGHLMLIVGEMDDNVPPESTYRLADALIKAKKEFELIVLPGVGHSSGEFYGNRKRMDFFVRHLLNQNTPDWNQEPEEQKAEDGQKDKKG